MKTGSERVGKLAGELAAPFVIYYLALFLAAGFVDYVLPQMTGQSAEPAVYAGEYVKRQIVVTILLIPVMFVIYRGDQIRFGRPGIWSQLRQPARTLGCGALTVIIAAFEGFAVNNVISMTPLMGASKGYSEASAYFYGSTYLLEVIGSAVLTPVLEELVYRGIFYQRLRRILPCGWSVLISSLLFGALHFNIVQCLYAVAFGVVAALLAEWTGHMWTAVLAHMTANFISVTRTEWGLLGWSVDGSATAWTAAVAALGLSLLLLAGYRRLAAAPEESAPG